MADSGVVDSMLQFWLERGVDVLVLAPWEVSTSRRGSVATSAGGEVVPGSRKGGDDAS
jgi:hypothetical protein